MSDASTVLFGPVHLKPVTISGTSVTAISSEAGFVDRTLSPFTSQFSASPVVGAGWPAAIGITGFAAVAAAATTFFICGTLSPKKVKLIRADARANSRRYDSKVADSEAALLKEAV